MAIPSITTAAEANQAGWTFFGADSVGWHGEKVVQEGRVLAVGSTSANLLSSMQQCEARHEKLALSPMRDKGHTWKGHI